ncbi:maleylacetoacetate isomerase [Acuticoccus kandeliae]|uniref:maleylacetoacetate isomerase n=1 Tax=Acuticoccus kandeliae TaxID=2073160 RepID=UPI000D3E11A6|nr:maleylacetoacetate isomerase [Acuticoccus kandeliae]
MSEAVLYDYWRSSASYRVRIALHAAAIPFRAVPIDLLAGAQHAPEHIARNPQAFVPVLEIDGLRLTQSLAIIDYVDRTRAAGFLPDDPAERARLLALAHVIASDTHPICNPSVVSVHVRGTADPEAARRAWMAHFIRRGLAAFDTLLDHPGTGPFCHGAAPGLADFCLVPQVYNAARWGVDTADLTRVNAVAEACASVAAFRAAAPVQPG